MMFSFTTQAKSSVKTLELVWPTFHHQFISGFCSCCVRQWHQYSEINSLNQQTLSSRRYANLRFMLLGKRFMAAKEINDEKIYTHHWIGPPDPVSNLRKFRFMKHRNPNKYDLLLEKERNETHNWNNEFWTYHNNKFFEEKKKFSKELEAKGISDKEGSDEMSQFYKYFLDRHYQLHVNYNKEWYRRNFRMLWLAILASLTRIFIR